MGQGTSTAEITDRDRARVVPVAAGDPKEHYVVVISDGLVDEISRRGREIYDFVEFIPDSTGGAELLMRALDVAGSLGFLVLAAPVMLALSLLLKAISGGPVLYRQKRIGKDGKVFALYKFRTMVNGAEEHSGPVWASKDDPRVTRIGRTLRKTRLDELPQLFNVLKGDMSLVGPRPERPYFVERHKALQGIRLAVKPGLTGLAQIRNFYNLKPEHKLKYDYLYIKRRSLLLNLYILLKTLPVLFTNKGW
jgi:lipopolysaccharide/colanic/teichoic acid biosynthesis glycosyltransferase